ncbi:Frag1/DRAM/Sfk1 family-domain-containing protein [Chaetomium fimeti]|uniref:Frag1/DRAM/Sfk1 family-domain-containing protein n=1 Tax=Chaetomium fimeti TaxID=1854472 RepID=A0AAE0LTI5_9PEZI|nr:Frag1/DRAM/Sfk1 family-domain-containing protein [Chaetomium fimeti]
MIRLSYWVTPILAGTVWLATLLALLLYWAVSEDYIQYSSMNDGQQIAYISDIGASDLKPLFVTGCVLTTVFLDISFAADRWLRHKGRLAPNTTTGEKVLSGLSIGFAIIGTVGLILLSIFDTVWQPNLHNIFLLLFIAGYVISAIFICWEYQRLGKHYREHRILRLSFWIKLTFVIVEVLLAVAFVACTFTRNSNAGAVLEWVIAFIFSFYVFSFYVDLYPAAATKHAPHQLRAKQQQQDQQDQQDQEKQVGAAVAPAPTMRLTRGDGAAPASRYVAAGEMEEGGSSDATLDGNATSGGAPSFEAARVAHGRRSGSRSRAMASNF